MVDPHSHDETVETVVRCVGIHRLPMLNLMSDKHTLIDEQDQSRDGRDQEPASIEQKIGIKERHLLSIVVCNQLERLH